MSQNQRLIRAEQAAESLIGDLRDILNYTDDSPLEQLTLEAIESLESIHRRLKRFIGRRNLDPRNDPRHPC